MCPTLLKFMKSRYYIIWSSFGLLFALLVFAGCKKDDELENVDCSTINSGYSTQIKPIIEANCLSSGCHNNGSANGDFTIYSGLKAKADNGSFYNRVIEQKNMPLSKELSMDELKKIKCWLNAGAPNN